MSDAALTERSFTVDGLWRGARDMVALSVVGAAFGVLCGLLSTGAGLSAVEAMLMTGLVFAGASQIAALDLIGQGIGPLAVIVAAAAVNARFLLMSATIAPLLRPLGTPAASLSLTLLVDINWGMSLARMRAGERDAGYFVGGGLILWSTSVLGTLAGSLAGNIIDDPAVWGLDFTAVALFLTMLALFWRGTGDLLPWGVAAAIAILTGPVLPAGLSIAAGALTGATVAAITAAASEGDPA